MKERFMKEIIKNIDGDKVTIIHDKCDYLDDDLPEELDLDWSKARPNPYAKKLQEQRKLFIELDPDIAKFFLSSKQVNDYLRKHLQLQS